MQKDPIEVSPKKLGGKPVFRGSRIPISYLSQYLEHGYSVGEFIELHDVDPEVVRAVYEQNFRGDESGEKTPA